MRNVPTDIASMLTRNIQTRAASSAPSANIWIGRPTTALTTEQFLERQTVLKAPVTDASIAVCHPRKGFGNTKVSIAYLSDGTARVATALHKAKMLSHAWADTGFSEPAVAVALAYDGTMPQNDDGRIEFVTESDPWIFWCAPSGMLCGQILNDKASRVVLAEQNCTEVAAVRATWSEASGFDFGLVCFFLLSGALYYRQRINGVWTDAAPITFGPPGVVWTELSASRTWDYRLVLQAKTSTGKVYELFTQFQGFAKRSIEHLEVKRFSPSGELSAVEKQSAAEKERFMIGFGNWAPYGGLYATRPPVMTAAKNIANGTGDWGKVLRLTLDVHVEPNSIADSATAFTITDENGAVFTASTATVGMDGKTVTLTFADFNAARGACQAAYRPGSAVTMAGVDLVAMEHGFMPENLVPPLVDPPALVSIQNDDTEGRLITLQFDLPLLSDPAQCRPSAFTVMVPEYNYVPYGSLEDIVKPVEAIQAVTDNPAALRLMFPPGRGSISNAFGEVTVAYAGGNLVGAGGAVAAFSSTFSPEGLIPKPDQNDAERIDVEMLVEGRLTRIHYINPVPQGQGHIEVTEFHLSGALIDVSDI